MKLHRVPVVLLLLLAAGFIADLVVSADALPPRLATHFDGSGVPNGWMSRSGHLLFTGALGIGLAAVGAGVLHLLRFLPVALINVPHRAFWFSEARRSASYAFLTRHGIWFAVLMLAFFWGIHRAVASANMQSPPALATGRLLVLTGGFLAGIAIWSVGLILRFRRLPPGAS